MCVCVCVWGGGGWGGGGTDYFYEHIFSTAGIYFKDPEITPAGKGIFRQDNSGTAVDHFPPEVEVRAIVENQIMAKFVHARNLGYQISGSSRVLATGGASQNPQILQVLGRPYEYH